MEGMARYGFWLITAAAAIVAVPRVTYLMRRAKYEPVAIDAARRHGLPDKLVSIVADVESAYDPAAKSPAGALGIMQIVPRWHPGIDPFDPLAAIDYAAGYLKSLYARYRNWPMTLAAYNWGPGNLDKKGWINAPAETRAYVQKIMQRLA